MIEKFNLECNCVVKENPNYNEETWTHITNCNHFNKELKEKINQIIDKVNE